MMLQELLDTFKHVCERDGRFVFDPANKLYRIEYDEDANNIDESIQVRYSANIN
jgi:hypothetical protein